MKTTMKKSTSPGSLASTGAANPLAVAILCHRAVKANSDLAGYRWGLERKPAPLEREAKK
jgi:AraC family transcriptional regulator, regulatory protein of adaptative response / methylated-DNA-[protein]-cysteine methyltransferase